MQGFEYKVEGNKGSTIIFLNGFRMRFETWDRVYPELTENNTVFLFNRYGVGKSPKASTPQNGLAVIETMHSMLKSLDMKKPYVLVGHSLGGLYANLYARKYPEQIKGMVFVESSHPSEVIEQKKHQPPIVLKVTNEAIKKVEKMFDPFKFSEDESIEDTLKQIEQGGSFPEIPITVVSGMKKMPLIPQKSFETHLNYQTKLLELSSKSKQYYCEESGHFPQITEPKKVIEAIHYILDSSYE